MTIKAQILNSETMDRVIKRISHEITEKNDGVKDIVVLGIKKRGVPFAKAISQNLTLFEGVEVPFGEIDITNKRDDYSLEKKKLLATKSIIPCDITGKKVILVDDVLYTGRTARAGIETVFDFGRPECVQLVVLIDRGHRELPIRPDYIGKNVPTSKSETVVVKFEKDGGVFICE